MKRMFLLVLMSVFVCTVTSSFSQDAPAVKGDAAAPVVNAADGKITLESLEGLSEEEILALIKKLNLDDIFYLLNQVINRGSNTLLKNVIGALNQYIASLDAEKAAEFAQRASQENPALGFGVSKDGTTAIYVSGSNTDGARNNNGGVNPPQDGSNENPNSKPQDEGDEEYIYVPPSKPQPQPQPQPKPEPGEDEKISKSGTKM